MSRCLIVMTLLLSLSMGIAYAAVIPLVNPSFDEPVISLAERMRYVVPDGWSVMAHPDWVLLFNDPTRWGMIASPEAGQFAGTYGTDTLMYQNTGVQIQAATTYAMSAYISSPSDNSMGLIALYASNSPIGALDTYISGHPEIVVGPSSWVQMSFSITIPDGSPLIGKYLCPVLRSTQGWVAWDGVTLSTPGNVSGNVNLSDFTGDLTLCPIKIEMKQGETVKYAQEVRPTTANPVPYAFTSVVPGTYDITFSAGQYLTKTLKDYVVASDVTDLDVTLTNGDIDGSGEITSTDVSVQLKNLNVSGN